MKRSLFYRLLAVAFVAAAASSFAADPPPNVLILFADDMGYSDIGCYGGEIATPNVDALAAQGLRFTQFYNTARCWPSRAALLTGYYAQQVRRDTVPGVVNASAGKRPGWAPLLSTTLHSAGYRCYHSGKWHVDGKPMQNGFDHSYDLEDHNRNFHPQKHLLDDEALPAVQPGGQYYTSTAIADYAIKFLREHAEKNAGKPFFSYVAFTAPHFPLQAPAEDIARYRDRYARGWDAMRQERWDRMVKMGLVSGTLPEMERNVGPPYAFPDAIKTLGPQEVNLSVPWASLTPEQRAFQVEKVAVYAAMIDRMDREIGRVLDQVRAMGAMENTIVLFLSDNGSSAEMMVRGDGHDPHAAHGSAATFLSLGPGWSSMANTPFRRHKTWVHEGGISTPLIVEWPRGIKARGELRTTPGHLVDIAPTILELVGIKAPPPAGAPPSPGRSLVPAFAENRVIPHDFLWWLHEENRALRVGDWKIVALKKGDWELYDLAKDRSESHNLAGEQTEKLRELVAVWEDQWTKFQANARSDQSAHPGAK